MVQLYSVPEVAQLLRINTSKAYKLINKGLLKATRLGRMKVSSKELERFIKAIEGKDLTDLDNIVDLCMNERHIE